MQIVSKLYLQSLQSTFDRTLPPIQTFKPIPGLPHWPLSWSSCLPWHHSIAWFANDKVANRYLSWIGPFLRQCRPPPGALQPNYWLWRTTASGLHCSCWHYYQARKVYNKVNGKVVLLGLFECGVSLLLSSSTNTAVSMYRNKDKTTYSCQVKSD